MLSIPCYVINLCSGLQQVIFSYRKPCVALGFTYHLRSMLLAWRASANMSMNRAPQPTAPWSSWEDEARLGVETIDWHEISTIGAACSIVVKLLDLDPQGRSFDPWCFHNKICTAVGPLSKALNPTLLQGVCLLLSMLLLICCERHNIQNSHIYLFLFAI